MPYCGEHVPNNDSQVHTRKNNDSVEMAPHGQICFVTLDCFQTQVCNFV